MRKAGREECSVKRSSFGQDIGLPVGLKRYTSTKHPSHPSQTPSSTNSTTNTHTPTPPTFKPSKLPKWSNKTTLSR
ncbi:hypothetical protein VTL71DRAFT_14135, partial [Oculimacula yallundae]